MLSRLRELGAIALVGGLVWSAPASAQNVADFYKGKQMEIITGGTPGSIYDHWSRALGHHMGKHLPGNPNFVVRNMPGGGHITATNYLANQSPRDGTVLGLVSRNMPLQDLVGNSAVRFKSSEFGWIGSPEMTNRGCVAYKNAKVKKAADLYQTELLVAGSGAGTAVSTTPILLAKLLGLKLKLVEGYQGGPEIFLAMERGEVEGVCQTMAAIESTGPGWIRDGKLNVLFNLEKDPLPGMNAPSVMTLTKTDEERAIIAFYNSSAELGRPVMTTPGIPADRLTALRRAFDATMKDKDFVAEAKRLTGLDVMPMTGEQVDAVAKRIAQTPKAIMDKTVAIVGSLGE